MLIIIPIFVWGLIYGIDGLTHLYILGKPSSERNLSYQLVHKVRVFMKLNFCATLKYHFYGTCRTRLHASSPTLTNSPTHPSTTLPLTRPLIHTGTLLSTRRISDMYLVYKFYGD